MTSKQRPIGVGRALVAVTGAAAAAGLTGCASPQTDGPAVVEIQRTPSDFVGQPRGLRATVQEFGG